jgi:hypothetical protein
MGRFLALPALTAACLLAGCDRGSGDISPPQRHGRYAGIGVFEPGRLWSRMAVPKQAKASPAATIADDEHVIVVVDSVTGEVRQCGDHSGYCVSMNPWGQGPAPEQRAPVPLAAHAADLQREDNAAVSNDAAPAKAEH